ncbi:MAG TPA: glycosyltransferase [Ferruginibacter sp.]|nr:glycosyltransferase [Ferruginibacter sp.]
MSLKKRLPVLYFTVTTDLSYDQRMIRICTSLASNGYTVVLVGRNQHFSIPLQLKVYQQKRIHCYSRKGKIFYAEYNFRLFIYLLFKKMDGICAIDLDTIIPCHFISVIKKIPKVYDAHELFCEMKEVVRRPGIYKIWKWIEKQTVPYFDNGYTVNDLIAHEFKKMYGKDYKVIRSIAVYEPFGHIEKEKFILYQGAVNEGRSFETLIPAMRNVEATLYICGDGNFMEEATKLCIENNVTGKVIFKGMQEPADLKKITRLAMIGITFFESSSLSNYYSLANRFFDYIHAGVPQLCVDYPVYREINNEYKVAVMLDDLGEQHIANELNKLLNDHEKWQMLHLNCLKASETLNWQNEEIKLLAFYKNIFG